MSEVEPCEPWCRRPADMPVDDMWVCPVCGACWDREAMIEKIVSWARDNVEPKLTELHLNFLRQFLTDPNYTYEPPPTNRDIVNGAEGNDDT